GSGGGRCGVYRPSISGEGRLYTNSGGAGGIVADLGDVGGDCRAREKIRSRPGIRAAAQIPASCAWEYGAEFLSIGRQRRRESVNRLLGVSPTRDSRGGCLYMISS